MDFTDILIDILLMLHPNFSNSKFSKKLLHLRFVVSRSWGVPVPLTACSTCVACSATTTPGPPRATKAGATESCCRSSGAARMRRMTRNTGGFFWVHFGWRKWWFQTCLAIWIVGDIPWNLGLKNRLYIWNHSSMDFGFMEDLWKIYGGTWNGQWWKGWIYVPWRILQGGAPVR